MNNLFQYINTTLSNGLTLKEIKEDFSKYIDSEVIAYSDDKANYTLDSYNKIKLQDYSNDLFEMILICWDAGSESKIHDHPEKGCVFNLMNGCLEEHLYDSNIEFKKITTVYSNNTSYMENSIGYHKIKCIDKAMSLHIYSPPNYKMKILGD